MSNWCRYMHLLAMVYILLMWYRGSSFLDPFSHCSSPTIQLQFFIHYIICAGTCTSNLVVLYGGRVRYIFIGKWCHYSSSRDIPANLSLEITSLSRDKPGQGLLPTLSDTFQLCLDWHSWNSFASLSSFTLIKHIIRYLSDSLLMSLSH